jgi:hypothetical protein
MVRVGRLDTPDGRVFADVYRPYIGSLEIRVLFRAEIDREGLPLVALDIDARWEGPPRCLGVTVLRRDAEDELVGTLRLPLEKLMRDAIAGGCRRVGQPVADARSVIEALGLPRRRTARRLSDDNLERAALIYTEALARGRRDPVACVVEELYLSRSTAGRWIMEARRKGYLPPTEPRRARASTDVDLARIGP